MGEPNTNHGVEGDTPATPADHGKSDKDQDNRPTDDTNPDEGKQA